MDVEFKVVMIDDEQGVCVLVKKILEGMGRVTVLTTTDSKTGESPCAQEKPDLVILDNVMPDMKGSDLIRKLRRNKHTQNIPIIMLTGKGEMIFSNESQAFHWTPNAPIVRTRGELEEQKNPRSLQEAYGVDAYMTKPLNTNLLLEIIGGFVARKQEKEDLAEWKRNNL